MRERLDSLDIKILEALGVYGPRSISEIARKVNVPIPTVRDRVKELKSRFSLCLHAQVYHAFIGLKKVFVFAKATPGNERLLWECMKANGYWLFVTARYDTPESFYGIYGIPIDHTEEFEQFVEQIEKLGIAQSTALFWSTSIQTVNLAENWYDHESEKWVFRWDKWAEDIESQATALPYTLEEPQGYPQKADWIDIIILKELQKNAECKLRDIARLLNVPSKTVQYHFKNHVVAKGMLEGYEVLLPHFEAASDSYCFKFDFFAEKNMAKFALSLRDKPFVRSIAKILGNPALLVRIYLPREEFRGFTDTLSKLIRNGLVKNYHYVIEDPSRKQAQTISYEFFKDKSWVYDHREHINRLLELQTSKRYDPRN